MWLTGSEMSRKHVQNVKFMKSTGKNKTIYSAGFVVNPGLPYFGCSPDGKVHDPLESPPFGILELNVPAPSKTNQWKRPAMTRNSTATW